MPKFDLTKINSPEHFPSVVLLYGEDTFTMDEELEKIKKFLIRSENDAVDCELISGEDIDLQTLINTASQYAMMSYKRVVIVRRFDKVRELTSNKSKTLPTKSKNKTNKVEPLSAFSDFLQMLKYNGNENSPTALILTVDCSDKKLDINKVPFDILINEHYSKEFPKIYENKLPQWVQQRFEKYKKKIDIQTANIIILQTPPDLRSLANEIEKIILYTPKEENITTDYVLDIIGSARQWTIFELINSVAIRDTNKAETILLNILSVSSQEVLIISQLTKLFVNLWKLLEFSKEGMTQNEMAKEIGVHQFFLKDIIVGLKKYSPDELNRAIEILCLTDKKIKSTNSNKMLLMQETLAEIMI